MKKLIFLIVILALAAANAFAARIYPAEGRVVDEQGQAVEYATVVLLKGSDQVAGMATDDTGRFVLKVPSGEYTLSVQYLGFDPVVRQVRVEENNDLGEIVMKSSATRIEGVVVKAQLIRREADRFVVDVANAPAAIGKDGIELLERAPGVWIDDEKISINGKSGSKVYVNDRELRMEPEQLLTYLRSLRAEEIQKIEVVPTTGADYDADSSGGIIRITLRKRRENGLDGSLSMRTTQNGRHHFYTPSGNINIHTGRLDLYASAWADLGKDTAVSDEHTDYTTGDTNLTSHSEITERDRNFGGSIGSVFEISPKHSIGAEFEYWRNNEKGPNDSYTDFTDAGAVTRTESRYGIHNIRDNYSATFNYIYKLDTLGSTLKLLADYTRRETETGNDNFSRITSPTTAVDSTYRDNSSSLYDITTATLALDKKFSPRWSLRAGAKFTYNDMHNDALYEYVKDGAWVRNDNQSFTINYTENIAAAYGIASANLGRWSLVAGLRGEYTHTRGKGGDISQNYFSLFPNANVSYALTKDGAYSLIAQYARTIERPRFWSLNPQRFQISDYTYQTGNPELDPAYKQDISLTLVLKHKYTLTGGMTIQRDEIQQTIRPDAPVPGVDQLRHDEKLLPHGQRTVPVHQMVDDEPQPHLHPAGAAHRRAQRRKTLQLLFRKQLDDLLAAREILHRPVVPVPEPHGLRQLLGKTAPFPERRNQEAFRRQVHRLVLGAQPDRAPAAHRRPRRRVRAHGRRQTAVERPQLHDRSDLQLQVGQSLQTQGGRSGFGRREKPPVKFPGQHHGTRDTRPGSHDPKHNIPERTQHRGTQHPQTCTAGHSIAGYNPDRVTGNTATRKAAS